MERANPRAWQSLEDAASTGDDHAAPIDLASSLDNPERIAMGTRIGKSLTDALTVLSPEHRAVIELAFGQSFANDEIARVMDCPVNTVKTRMFHARKQLSRLLQPLGVHTPPPAKEDAP